MAARSWATADVAATEGGPTDRAIGQPPFIIPSSPSAARRPLWGGKSLPSHLRGVSLRRQRRSRGPGGGHRGSIGSSAIIAATRLLLSAQRGGRSSSPLLSLFARQASLSADG